MGAFIDIYKYKVGCIMYKMIVNNYFPSLLNCIAPHVPDHSYETRFSDRFVLPFPTVENVRMNFKYQFINVWNDIPNNIKLSPSFSMFKLKYYEHLIDSYA